MADTINNNRLETWNMYNDGLKCLKDKGLIETPVIPEGCEHNAHMFYIKAKDLEERTKLITFLKENDIQAVFHYIPLHTSPAGLKYGRFSGEDKYVTRESDRLLRLPMYYNMDKNDVYTVIDKIKEFYNCK
jgi:dTDP-4-amino-4,6-dideoxygalactose transaminase